MEAIAAALGVPRSHVASLVRQAPSVAALPLDLLAAATAALSVRLALPPRQVLHMVAQQPDVVHTSPEELLRQCEELAAATELPTEMVRACVRACVLGGSPPAAHPPWWEGQC